jgi:hypothetical protein
VRVRVGVGVGVRVGEGAGKLVVSKLTEAMKPSPTTEESLEKATVR